MVPRRPGEPAEEALGRGTLTVLHRRPLSPDDLWRKLWGTNAPGLKMAGTFYLPEGLAFLDDSPGNRCLVIETRHERYRTIIVQTGDADVDSLAAEINRRVRTAGT